MVVLSVGCMRFLHTSDWHLGRSFHEVRLLDAQAAYVDHLVDVVRRERVDAVLVSGDVYDRAQPAPETVQLLSEALPRLVDAGAQVVLSSGNHDSAIRLGFAAPLLESAGVHVRTDLGSLTRPVTIGGVDVYPLPYLEPCVVADRLGATDRTHAAVMRAAVSAIEAARTGRPAVLMAHAFVAGGVGSESERDISVGGVSAVPVADVAGFDYVAMGHLHGRQRITDTVRYSGSPVAMSFSEWSHRKVSLLVDLPTDGGAVRVTDVEAPVQRALRVLRGDLDDLLADPALTSAQDAYCQVTLTDAVRPLGALERVRRRFPHTLALQFSPQGAGAPTVTTYAERTAARSDLDLCCDFVQHVRGGAAATGAERSLLHDAIEGARVERDRRDDGRRAA